MKLWQCHRESRPTPLASSWGARHIDIRVTDHYAPLYKATFRDASFRSPER